MKFFILTIFIGVCPFYTFSEELQSPVDLLLDEVEFSNFVSGISKVKKYKSVEDIGTVEYRLKKYYKYTSFWKQFDEWDYSEKLKDKLTSTFTNKEILEILKKVSSPFLSKMIKSLSTERNYFEIYASALSPHFRQGRISKNNKKILQSLYGVLGLKIQADILSETISEIIKSKVLKVPLVSSDLKGKKYILVETRHLQKIVTEMGPFTLGFLAEDLSFYSKNEIREFLRQTNSPLIHKFLQFYVNYHFIYFTNYIKGLSSMAIKNNRNLKL